MMILVTYVAIRNICHAGVFSFTKMMVQNCGQEKKEGLRGLDRSASAVVQTFHPLKPDKEMEERYK